MPLGSCFSFCLGIGQWHQRAFALQVSKTPGNGANTLTTALSFATLVPYVVCSKLSDRSLGEVFADMELAGRGSPAFQKHRREDMPSLGSPGWGSIPEHSGASRTSSSVCAQPPRPAGAHQRCFLYFISPSSSCLESCRPKRYQCEQKILAHPFELTRKSHGPKEVACWASWGPSRKPKKMHGQAEARFQGTSMKSSLLDSAHCVNDTPGGQPQVTTCSQLCLLKHSISVRALILPLTAKWNGTPLESLDPLENFACSWRASIVQVVVTTSSGSNSKGSRCD